MSGGRAAAPAHQVGRVTDRDPAAARVRVVFDALDALVSGWLPVLQQKTLRDQAYWMPDLDEHVVCLVDVDAEWGVVLGAIYSAAAAPPVASADRWHRRFADGTTIDYDRAAHRLAIALPAGGAEVVVTAAGDVRVTAGGDVAVHVPDGRHVYLGDAAGARRVATEEHVRQTFLTHKHMTAMGPTSPPIPTGTELEWPRVSERAEVR